MLRNQPKSTFRAVRFPALPSQAASSSLAMQYQLEASQWQSSQALLRRQLGQLQLSIGHAHQSVPYYRHLFDEWNVVLPEVFSLDFVRSLPITRRSMIQGAGEKIRSQSLLPKHGKTHDISTSGSTGLPVKLLGTGVTRFFWRAFALRELAWHERDMSQKMAAIRWAPRHVGKAPDGVHLKTWGSLVDDIFETGPSCMLNVATPLQEQIAWLQREQPYYLVSFPSNLAALARYCLDHKIEINNLNEIRTVGEMLLEPQRELFKQAWNAKTVDIYTCEETGYLAIQCPLHDHYHVQSENVFLEIVDEQDRACPPHQPGRVLISTLHNFATPLIRYELGDYAEFGDPCSCGRGLPVIKQIFGRKRNRLIFPDGRSEFPYLGEHGQIEGMTGVKVFQFQFVQHSIEAVELKLVTSRPFTEEERQQVVSLTHSNLGYPFDVTITLMDDIPKGPTGKFEEFVSRVDI